MKSWNQCCVATAEPYANVPIEVLPVFLFPQWSLVYVRGPHFTMAPGVLVEYGLGQRLPWSRPMALAKTGAGHQPGERQRHLWGNEIPGAHMTMQSLSLPHPFHGVPGSTCVEFTSWQGTPRSTEKSCGGLHSGASSATLAPRPALSPANTPLSAGSTSPHGSWSPRVSPSSTCRGCCSRLALHRARHPFPSLEASSPTQPEDSEGSPTSAPLLPLPESKG